MTFPAFLSTLDGVLAHLPVLLAAQRRSSAPNPSPQRRAASSSPIVCPSASTDPAGAVDPDVFVDEAGEDLSDHQALEVVFSWKRA